jgi:sulfotransferase
MESRIHFISGLPRSGSTLLSAILRQNPRFHAMMTSPVGNLYLALLSAMSRRNETAVFINEKQKRELLRGVFYNYYHDMGPDRVIFDTNRMWCTKLPALVDHFPNSKVICCVRSLSWIMDSIERLVRRNAFELSGIFGFDAGGTVYTRVNRLATNDGMVGFALDALREAFFGEQADRLIFVTYQALARQPRETLGQIYNFIGEKWYEHDFDNVEYDADEFDLPIGSPGLHTVRRKVEFIERQTILPPELFARFEGDSFWMNPELNINRVPILLPGDGTEG